MQPLGYSLAVSSSISPVAILTVIAAPMASAGRFSPTIVALGKVWADQAQKLAGTCKLRPKTVTDELKAGAGHSGDRRGCRPHRP
jgi:hypothetical protein